MKPYTSNELAQQLDAVDVEEDPRLALSILREFIAADARERGEDSQSEPEEIE